MDVDKKSGGSRPINSNGSVTHRQPMAWTRNGDSFGASGLSRRVRRLIKLPVIVWRETRDRVPRLFPDLEPTGFVDRSGKHPSSDKDQALRTTQVRSPAVQALRYPTRESYQCFLRLGAYLVSARHGVRLMNLTKTTKYRAKQERKAFTDQQIGRKKKDEKTSVLCEAIE